MNKIFTLDIATALVECFEDVLDRYNIIVPSPEDDERDEENSAKLYGTVYGDLVDEVESYVIALLEAHTSETEIVVGTYSGTT